MTENMKYNPQPLQGLLERFGADPQRWPQDVAARLSALIAANTESQKLYDEFVGLERLLSEDAHQDAAQRQPRHDDLVARIMEDFDSSPRVIDDNVVALPHPERNTGLARSGAWLRAQSWPNVLAAGSLAASLLVGVTAGATGVFDTAFGPVASVLGLETTEQRDLAMLELGTMPDLGFGALDDGAFDEDFL